MSPATICSLPANTNERNFQIRLNQDNCLVTYPELAVRVKEIMVEAFESVGVTPTIKITAFNVEAQDARRSDPSNSES